MDDIDNIRSQLSRIVCNNDGRALETLLKNPFALENIDDSLVLIEAVRYDRGDSFNVLLEHNADPNVCDMEGWTPLIWAAFQENITFAEALLGAGADPAMENYQGDTAFTIANERNNEAMIALLL